MSGKGDKRIRARSPGLYRDNYDRIFTDQTRQHHERCRKNIYDAASSPCTREHERERDSADSRQEPLECPHCGQIDLIPQVDNPPMWECRHCKHEVQF